VQRLHEYPLIAYTLMARSLVHEVLIRHIQQYQEFLEILHYRSEEHIDRTVLDFEQVD
jgi:hypothetical protein